MDLRQIEIFLAVGKHLHFGHAADELGLSQPTVSQSIAKLERDLGSNLFQRTTRRVTFTPFGEFFYRESTVAFSSIVSLYDRARRYANRSVSQLTIGYVTDHDGLIAGVLPVFRSRYPDARVEARRMSSPEQMASLESGEIDVAVLWEPNVVDEFESVVIGSSGLLAIVGEGHRFTGMVSVSMRDIASEPLMTWSQSDAPHSYAKLTRALDETGAEWRVVGQARGLVNMASLVLSGVGVGVLYAQLTYNRRLPGTVYLLVDDGPIFDRHVMWRRADRNELVSAFVELATLSATATGDRQAVNGSNAPALG